MLHIQHYKKTYGIYPVLQIENLQLDKGVYWLKGENGSGKTTLLRSVAGLISFEGIISVAGITLRRQRMRYTRIVSFSEAEPVYPDFLTGHELVSFYLQTKGGSAKQMTGIAEALKMAPYLSQKTAIYSSGMLKKLSLLLSFAGEPQLILLDEPFLTLDAAAIHELRTMIRQKSREQVSFLISSHQQLALEIPYQSLLISGQTIETNSDAATA